MKNMPFVCFAISALLMSGCAMDPERVENDFGNSVRQMVAGQIHEPEAASNPDSEGPDLIDGVAVDTGVESYREAFKRKSGDTRTGISLTVE